MSTDILVCREDRLDAQEFLGVLQRSGLAQRRPADDVSRIAAMAANGNLIVAARDAGRLVGVARSVTDFAYCCYCSDLAVDRAYQGQGLGQRLIEVSRAELHPKARFYLVSAPAAVGFYERIGMQRVENCFRLAAE